ncbi:MAG: VWA domain-containing protein [Luteolibacter sp.]
MMEFIQHFRFAQPLWLWLLVPALLLPILRRGRGPANAVIFPNLSILVSLGQRVRERVWNFGLPLAFAALIVAIFAMARPVWRNHYQDQTSSGIDIVVALDVSLSMEIDDFLQNDRPTPRIKVAKEVIDQFITWRPNDRIGLVAFAGRPVSICPITLDHNWLRQGLSAIRLEENGDGTVKEQGTAIGSALAAAATRLDNRETKSKVIVLITDGASNSGKISPIEAAENAKVLGMKIYTVAIGTTEGRVSRNIQRFPRQEFDLPTLQKIAELTGGQHYWAQNLDQLKSTFTTIDQLEKSETKVRTRYTDTELFGWFVGLSLLLTLAAAGYLALHPSRTS